ncbi:cysteine repeat modular protein 1, putative [Plasmodium chabaudi adami]|uniref:Cysteine repeat modular protein 1, putative n=1 Tax=Plasmodium chabaudi adami TaxID=5826 RepID=A0A1C6Y9W4_PLACE|nr:cysteine repeat modular protein 1, putative [Plasmodium chabaudi adami]
MLVKYTSIIIISWLFDAFTSRKKYEIIKLKNPFKKTYAKNKQYEFFSKRVLAGLIKNNQFIENKYENKKTLNYPRKIKHGKKITTKSESMHEDTKRAKYQTTIFKFAKKLNFLLYTNFLELYSSLQILLTQYCHPRIARCDSKSGTCWCYKGSKLFINMNKYSCLDNCGNFVTCKSPFQLEPYEKIPQNFILNKIIITCIVSSIQRKLNNLCGKNKLFRTNASIYYCIPNNAIDLNIIGKYCISDIKTVIQCHGFIQNSYISLIEEFKIIDKEKFDDTMNNICDEHIIQNGETYLGCQNRSISGKICLPWNTINTIQTNGPKDIKHNFCRNFEGKKTIYCFVRFKDFIYREFCKVKEGILTDNNITYSRQDIFIFDLTMKNVSDFDIRISNHRCINSLNNNKKNNFNFNVIKTYELYKYHEIDNEIALTIGFLKSYHQTVGYLRNNDILYICACSNNYYKSEVSSCHNKKYHTQIGRINFVNKFTNTQSNVLYLSEIDPIFIDLYNEAIKNKELYIFNADYSYQCDRLSSLENKTHMFSENILNISMSYVAQKINPPLDTTKKKSYLYEYGNIVYDLKSLITNFNERKFNQKHIIGRMNKYGILMNTSIENNKENINRRVNEMLKIITIQQIKNLQKGSNIICIKHDNNQEIYFSYIGRIIYTGVYNSKDKYILINKNSNNNHNSIYENIIYINNSFYPLYDNLFSISPNACSQSSEHLNNAKILQLSHQNHISRFKNMINPSFSYNYYSRNKHQLLYFFEKKKDFFFFTLKNMFNKKKDSVDYLCQKINNIEEFKSNCLFIYSSFHLVYYIEFAHPFYIYTIPTSMHNNYIRNDKDFDVLKMFFDFKNIDFISHKTKILSLWSHQNDNFVSLWLTSSQSLTPFFLAKYDIHSPKYSFVFLKNQKYVSTHDVKNAATFDNIDSTSVAKTVNIKPTLNSKLNSPKIETNSDIVANIYAFSEDTLMINKYETIDFFILKRVKSMLYTKMAHVSDIITFTFNNEPFFLLLFKNNRISILNSNLDNMHIDKHILNIHVYGVPIKIKCDKGDKKLTCFVLYKYHKILWIDLLFSSNNLVKENSNINNPSITSLKDTHKQRTGSSNFLENQIKSQIGNIEVKYIYIYEEQNAEILSDISNDMVITGKLNDYVIYISNKESNRIHIYFTNRYKENISYYKYIKNEHTYNYNIISLFTYNFQDTTFINSHITKSSYRTNAITSFAHENLIVTKIKYNYNPWYIYNEKIMMLPIIEGDKIQIKYFSIHYKKNKSRKDALFIDKETGAIKIILSEDGNENINTQKDIVNIKVVMHGLFHTYRTEIEFSMACEDGHYHKHNKCHPCEKGYYNNLNAIKKNNENYSKCIACGKNRTTLAEKEKFEKNCVCDLGYEYIKDPNNPRNFICSPCSYGEYKDSISNELCKGTICIENASHFILDKKGIQPTQCFCNGGYYLHHDKKYNEKCVKCLDNHYCPNNDNYYKKCPIHNATVQNNRTDFESIDSCLCEKGYEPININKIKNTKTRDYHYYNIFITKYPDLLNIINNNNICMECNLGFYKNNVSSDKCIKCPGNSTTTTFGSKHIENCNSCHKGYYKDKKKYCSKCLPNHFCVGKSVKNDKHNISQYAGDAVICPNYSVTLRPYEDNFSFKDCLCIKGYEKNFQDFYNISNHCKKAPLNFYKDTISNSVAIPCPDNSITLQTGATSIHNCICNKGFFYDQMSYSCVECPYGYYCSEKDMTTKLNPPIKCPKNYTTIYSGSYDISNCVCESGYTVETVIVNHYTASGIIQSYENAKNKIKLQTKNKTSVCVKCPKSSYKTNISNEQCHECPKNATTLKDFNNADIFFCLCNMGYYTDKKECKPCWFNKLYCEGEKIYQIETIIYDEIIDLIKKYIGFLSEISDKKSFINTIINEYINKGLISEISHISMVEKNSEILANTIQNIKKAKTDSEIHPLHIYNRLGNIATKERQLKTPKTNNQIKKIEMAKSIGNKIIANINSQLTLLSEGNQNNDTDTNILANLFYKSSTNLIYIKHQKLINCQQNTVIPLGFESSQNFDDCKCKKGYYLEDKNFLKNIKICKPCPEGTFKNFVGDVKNCISCPPKSTSIKGSIYPNHCFCKEGFFYSKDMCLECLEGGTCNGGLYPNAMKKIKLDIENVNTIGPDDHVKPESKIGYYLDESIINIIDVSEWRFIKCPISDSCLGKNKCHITMDNYLCIECKKGYTNSFTKSKCINCPNNITNIILLILIYIIFCFIIIIISYLNISSGFYRRSIHSIIVKIAINYVSSMLIVNILEDTYLNLPSYAYDVYNKMANILTSGKQKKKIISIDCLLRYYFNLTYNDSFFYTSLFFFLMPIFLMLTLTGILFVILKIYTIVQKEGINNKLYLLGIAKKENILFLVNSLETNYKKERFIMILRYIKLPDSTMFDSISTFFEDMIPIYATFLFLSHAKTSLRMLQLFDCSNIQYAKNFSKYILNSSSSVQCNFKTHDYFKFFILGISGTILWALGIPFLAFFILYKNRHNLFHENIRIKYGFLHNGYLPNRWYWEVVVFIRKITILFVTTVIVFPSDKKNIYKLLIITFIAIFSLCIHFIFQPFDKRKFFILNKLENFSLYIWVSTIMIISVLMHVNLNEFINFLVFFFIILLHTIFFIKLLISLFYECISNIRPTPNISKVPFINSFIKVLVQIVEAKKKQEPQVCYDKCSRQLAVILPHKVSMERNRTNIYVIVQNFFKKFIRNNSSQHSELNQFENRAICAYESEDKEKNKMVKLRSSENIEEENYGNCYNEIVSRNQKTDLSNFLLKNTNLSIYGKIKNEHRMFAIEIYNELLDIFLKHVTFTYIPDTLFEFIFKISVNIGKFIDELDKNDKIFETLNQLIDINNMIQWPRERKGNYYQTEQIKKNKICFINNSTSSYDLVNREMPSLDYSFTFSCNDIEKEQIIKRKKKEKQKTKDEPKKLYISTEERKKLFSFFSDDLLKTRIHLSKFYFILIELRIKYFRNLPSYFYLFKLYKLLSKKREMKKLKMLNKKLERYKNISHDNETPINNQDNNDLLKNIKKNIHLLYKEFKELSKIMNQLKYEYLNIKEDDSNQSQSSQLENE